MKPTRFQSRATTMQRMTEFGDHLRRNGLCAGLRETRQALQVLAELNLARVAELRLALKPIYCTNEDAHRRFDGLFDSYWFNNAPLRHRIRNRSDEGNSRRPSVRSMPAMRERIGGSAGEREMPDDGADGGEAASSGEGRLIGSRIHSGDTTDLRNYVLPEDRAAAEDAARRIAGAIRYRRSRRRKSRARGETPDMRRIIRKSVARGGEPIELVYRKRPEKPAHLVVLLDVSGSMQAYARVFLSFVKGLTGQDQTTDAYLFHTRLMRVTDALRDRDSRRAVQKLSILAQGFGGGTRIGSCLNQFLKQYASRMLNGRSVVIILSDGYDTGPARDVGEALKRLKGKGCRLIWLNPLLGWEDYQPVAASMRAALPWLDGFAACNTLASLGGLEGELCRV